MPQLSELIQKYPFTSKERFLEYVQIDTQSDPHSSSSPTTEKQKNLGKVLVQELQNLGISNAHLDEYGYVYAHIASNVAHDVPGLCFCAHMDTSPDCSGTQVKPIVHPYYHGQDLVLPDDPNVVIRLNEHPDLAEQIGHDIITASGTTLLGADNKAGVAEIMDVAAFYFAHPNVPHGPITILFTPDEEVGMGTAHFNVEEFGADYAYTIDGDAPGAQKLGTRFKVRGYPTLILFSPNGHEITRLPGEADAAQVMKVLQLGLSSGRPVKAVLADARAGRKLNANEWRLLGFYGWETDEQQLLPVAERAATLAQLAKASEGADTETATRLWLKSVGALAEGKTADPAGLPRLLSLSLFTRSSEGGPGSPPPVPAALLE